MRTVGRLGLLALCYALSSTREAPRAEASPESNPASVSSQAAAAFGLQDLPLPRRSAESRCVAALAADKPDEARRIALAALAKAKEPARGRLRYLLAKATSDPGEARSALQALADSPHPLAIWARLRLAERLRDSDPNAAAQVAEALMGEPQFRARAELLLALSLYAAGRNVEAEPLLRSLLAETPQDSAAAHLALPLANILADKPDAESHKQALSLCRRVITRAPLSSAANVARPLAERMLATLTPAERVALAQPTVDEAFDEASALQDGGDYRGAAQAYAALAERVRGDARSVCEAKVGQGKALTSIKRPEGLDVFREVIDTCKAPSQLARAMYMLARGLLRSGQPQEAITHYLALAQRFPQHRLTDDALLAAASTYVDLGDEDAARAQLRQLLHIAPQGDMYADARFMLAWLERKAHHYDDAIAELDLLIARGPGERAEDIVGRARYWRARTLLDRGDRAAAIQGLRELIVAHPLAYYSQQALARLREIDPAVAKQMVASLRADTHHPELALSARPELQGPGFERAVELLRVGEPDPAVEELQALGCFRRTADDDLYFLGAALLQEFGDDGTATTLARHRVRKVMSSLPKGRNLAYWRVEFPRAYRPLIEDIARNAEVPPAFVRAVAREESSFEPTAVSRANAYGLIQLIRPTARAFAKPLGLPCTPEALKQPEVNLRIGTSFMRSLFERYKANPALVPSAYNAGLGATDRWLRERPNLALDEWIETIPYRETRRYTRRVLQSYGVYAWLYEGRIPELPRALPPPR